MGMKPFDVACISLSLCHVSTRFGDADAPACSCQVVSVFQEGSVLDPKVLDITDADIVSLFLRA
eukprot:3555818-Rhodomonas_salina.1